MTIWSPIQTAKAIGNVSPQRHAEIPEKEARGE